DVQCEAIFTFSLGPEIANGMMRSIGLNTARPEDISWPDAGPYFRRLRRPPPQRAERGLCVRNTAENADRAVEIPLPVQFARLSSHYTVVHQLLPRPLHLLNPMSAPRSEEH